MRRSDWWTLGAIAGGLILLRVLFRGVVQPIRGGAWWSANKFVPGVHDGRDAFPGPKTAAGWPDATNAVVVSILPGVVVRTAHQDNGYWVLVDHGNGIQSRSGHLGSLAVKAGDVVKAGSHLGRLAGADVMNPPHLHFEIELHGQLIDPAVWLLGQGASAVWI